MAGNQNKQIATRLIAHTSLYRLTIPSVVERLFFSNKDFPDPDERAKKTANLLASLARRKMLESHPFPQTKNRFYTIPGTKLEPSTIDYDLALLWWCHCMRENRHRVTRDELRQLLPEDRLPHHHLRHCLSETTEGGHCVYRMYPTTGTNQRILENLRKKHIPALKKCHPGMADHGELGIAVLVSSKDAKAHLMRALNREPRGNGGVRLLDQLRIVVDIVPNTLTIDSTTWLKNET